MGSIGSPDELVQWQKEEVPGNGGGGGGRNEKIYVSVRLRPLNAKEIERNDPAEWESINNNTVIFKNGLQERSMYPSAYTFDRVFGFKSTTKQVYEEGAKEVVLSVVSGINSSVFAYGQTSSGKTYTMTGITEYTVEDIYDYIEKHEEREFTLKFSAMEIYNEAVRDLLSADSSPLRLLDDPERGTIVEKLTEETLRDQDHLKELLSVCEAQRQIGETSLNEMSSRSHQILRLTIESAARKFVSRESSSTLSATVNFVDLAGSERASQALSAGTRLKEGCHINRSLLTLGTVIRKLSKGRNGHVPYRDSKLTRILQSSLGGNARTAIICTMSPARTHTEQSRNTLLFASCAKEVSTNAHVNVVMSDKALVKHLQKELARLETELRCSGSAPSNSHDEALRDKEVQIKKMEREIKDLRQQRDLAQSRLEDLLRSVGDDQTSRQGDDQTSRQWDESSQSSLSLHNASEDALSVSEVSGIAYQNPYIDSARIGTLYDHYNPNENHFEHSEETEETVTSPTHSICSSTFIREIPQQGIEENSEAKSQSSEDHCKEVQCIEIHTLSTNKDEEFNLLLPDEDCSLLSLTDEDKIGTPIQPLSNAHSRPAMDELPECVTLKFSKSDPDVSSQLPSKQISTSPKELPIVRSSSCKPSLMTTHVSSLCEDAGQDNVEPDNKTPPECILKDFSERPGEVQRRLPVLENGSTDTVPQASRKLFFDDPIKTQDVQIVPEEDVMNLDLSSVGHEETNKTENQKQVSEDQETQTMDNEFMEAKKPTKDIVVDPVPSPLDSPSKKWALEFEKKQQEIVELWHACNVSLVHRTYFFLLFKGDPVDSFYMEVELRRLSFMKSSLSHGSSDNILAEDGHVITLASSLRYLRHERDMLYKKMQKKLSLDEKMELYEKWGIDLNTKQRRLQVARKIWTATDMQHVRESAAVVAQLVGPLGDGQALKEMFGLSFTPQLSHRRSFSWMQGKSFK